MTPRQIEILQHSLGVDQYGRTPKGWRAKWALTYTNATSGNSISTRRNRPLRYVKA